jgi:hypothetical protein
MRYVLALVFLSVSVFILIFAKQFYVDLNGNSSLNRLHVKGSLNENPKNLFWFLQISDIHISKFKDKNRVVDFRNFCSEVFEAYQKPKVVIASGD